MNRTNISQIDLNLLLILDAVGTEKNTVRAAEKLGLTQPAVSHALNRLRDIFGDRLFVRASRGVVPTPLAQSLQIPVRELIAKAEVLFLGSSIFNPQTTQKQFKLATTDYFEQIEFPTLIQSFQTQAPLSTLISRSTLGVLPEKELESGEIDLAIAGFYGDLPPRFFKQKIFEDDFVCIGSKNNSSLKGNITIEKFAQFKHILISPQGDLQSKSKAIMKKKGFNLNYVAGVSSFLSPAKIISESDLVLTCPRRLAESFLDYFPLKIHELPFKIPPIEVVQVWHERNQDDHAHQWLRKLIRDNTQ